jgi:hypothetical protein
MGVILPSLVDSPSARLSGRSWLSFQSPTGQRFVASLCDTCGQLKVAGQYRRLPLCPVALALLAATIPASAQPGFVTFYSISLSAKKQVKVALAPTGTVAFTGWLLDGDKKMAHATRGRFMTFQLPQGIHDFGAYYKVGDPRTRTCPAVDCLHLNVESGKHYCVRLSAKDRNAIVVPIMFLDSRIEQVSCQVAFEEAGKYKQTDLKRVEPAFASTLDSSPEFPKDN